MSFWDKIKGLFGGSPKVPPVKYKYVPGQKCLIIGGRSPHIGKQIFLRESTDFTNAGEIDAWWTADPALLFPSRKYPRNEWCFRERHLLPIDDPDIDEELRNEEEEKPIEAPAKKTRAPTSAPSSTTARMPGSARRRSV